MRCLTDGARTSDGRRPRRRDDADAPRGDVSGRPSLPHRFAASQGRGLKPCGRAVAPSSAWSKGGSSPCSRCVASLRVAAVPLRAFDHACGRCSSECVGTKGVPPDNRHPCGASNKGRCLGRQRHEGAGRFHQLNRPVGRRAAEACSMMTGDEVDRGGRASALLAAESAEQLPECRVAVVRQEQLDRRMRGPAPAALRMALQL